MDIKYKLQEYRWIKENISELEDRLLEIDTKLQKITSNISADKVQSSKDPDKWTELICKRIEIEKLINSEIENGYREMEFIEKSISTLPEREKRLMRLRYIDGKKWEEICLMMNYEWTQIHRIHGEALKKIQERYDGI